MRSILSELARRASRGGREHESRQPKTKLLAEQLKGYGLDNVDRCVRGGSEPLPGVANLHKVDVRDVEGVDPVSLIAFDKVAVTGRGQEV